MQQRKLRQQEKTAAQAASAQPSGRPNINEKSQKIFEKMVQSQKIEVHGSYEDYLINRGKQYASKKEDKKK